MENVRKMRRFHPRCGTSFLIIMLLVSILVGFVIPPSLNMILRTAIKPTPTIFQPQNTIDFKDMTELVLTPKGRHDPAIVHRARVVQDAATAIVMCDALAMRYGTDWLKSGDD